MKGGCERNGNGLYKAALRGGDFSATICFHSAFSEEGSDATFFSTSERRQASGRAAALAPASR